MSKELVELQEIRSEEKRRLQLRLKSIWKFRKSFVFIATGEQLRNDRMPFYFDVKNIKSYSLSDLERIIDKLDKETVPYCKKYRERFGLESPTSGAMVKVKYISVLMYYITWVDCPDLENILASHFITEKSAIDYANGFGWVVE